MCRFESYRVAAIEDQDPSRKRAVAAYQRACRNVFRGEAAIAVHADVDVVIFGKDRAQCL